MGAEAVGRAAPDGYTLLIAPPPPLAINQSLYPKLSFDPTNFVPLAVVATVPNVLVVNPNLKVSTVEELIAFAKANRRPSGYDVCEPRRRVSTLR